MIGSPIMNKSLELARIVQSFTLSEAIDFGVTICEVAGDAGFKYSSENGEPEYYVALRLNEWASEVVCKFETKEAAE